MKKCLALILSLLMICLCAASFAEEAAERSVASYAYDLAEGADEYVENLIFPADVIISGNNAKIIFSNCAFGGNVILMADEGTKVMLFGCDAAGTCVIENDVAEASLEYNNPKFLSDRPVNVVCEGGAGSAVGIGDSTVTFNGETYTMADSQMYLEQGNFAPYAGQEADYFCVAQWYQNGKQVMMVVCEKE